MSWLKQAMLQANKPKQTVISVLKKNLGGWIDNRPRTTLHASDMTRPNFCPRLWAFKDLHEEVVEKQFLNTALAVTFSMGTAAETLFVEEWAGDAAIGNWECRYCSEQRSWCSKPSGHCPDGRPHWWKYLQIVIEDPQSEAVGSIDCLFDIGAPKLRVTEIKTLAAGAFDEIVAPLPEHRLRTSLYLKLIAESNHPYKDRFNLHTANVIYISRGYGRKHDDYNGEILPFREYEVQRDDAAVEPLLQKARAIKRFRTTGEMPSGICATAFDKVAKNCGKCKDCFSGKHPAIFHWENQ